MAHRIILTARQRAALFDLPTDEASMLCHYTLAKMLIQKGLTVREAAARIKVGKTALYDAIKSDTSRGSPD